VDQTPEFLCRGAAADCDDRIVEAVDVVEGEVARLPCRPSRVVRAQNSSMAVRLHAARRTSG